MPCECDATGRVGAGANNLRGWMVFAGCAAVDGVLWRRARRRCLPGVPVQLRKVAPPVGVGSGANVTPLGVLAVGTLRGASCDTGGMTGVALASISGGAGMGTIGTTLRAGSVVLDVRSVRSEAGMRVGSAIDVMTLVSCVRMAW